MTVALIETMAIKVIESATHHGVAIDDQTLCA